MYEYKLFTEDKISPQYVKVKKQDEGFFFIRGEIPCNFCMLLVY